MTIPASQLPLLERAETPAAPPFVLRAYQLAAVEAVHQLTRYAPSAGTVIEQATGLGKTVVACQILKDRGPRGLILVHRDELVQQSVKTLARMLPQDSPPGIVQAEEDEWDAEWVVASVQSLRERRLRRWKPGHFRTVVVDECHHGIAPTYERVINYLEAPLVLGLSATPYRGDKLSIAPIFPHGVCYSYAAPEGIRDGWLVDPRGWRPGTDVLIDEVHTRGGDFVEGELSTVVDTPGRNRIAVKSWHRLAEGRRTVAFTCSVAHAQHLCEAFQDDDVAAEWISGETPRHERREILGRFSRGELKVLCNCMVLTEGYDETRIECILLARPTKSLGLWTQMVGRGLRTSPGKVDLVIIDLADTTSKHKLIGMHSLVGMKRPLRDGMSLREAIEQVEAQQNPWINAASRLRPKTEEVGPLWIASAKRAAEAGEPPDIGWTELYEQILALRDFESPEGAAGPLYGGSSSEYQQRALQGFGWPTAIASQLSKSEASWALDRISTLQKSWITERIPMLAILLDQDEQAVYDALLGKRDPSSPGDHRGLWQLRPASPPQSNLLRHRQLPAISGLTMGEASLLIDRIKTGGSSNQWSGRLP